MRKGERRERKNHKKGRKGKKKEQGLIEISKEDYKQGGRGEPGEPRVYNGTDLYLRYFDHLVNLNSRSTPGL
jgi:hypothetical protein